MKKYSRRYFIKSAAITSTLAIVADKLSAKPHRKIPIVISTWDFGVAANDAAWQILSSKGNALDAVEQGVKIAEADIENQSVGYGGLPDRDGIVTLDACIMDHLGNCGAVLALEEIKHPISVARLVMEKTPHVMLAGKGALDFAKQNGFKSQNLLTKKSENDWKEWLKTSKYKPESNIENKLYKKISPLKLPGNQFNHDTIGMLALDANGNLSGACTTSGMAYKLHGRVGDSPIIGAGLYVDNEIGAATATGVGEEVVRNVGSFLIVELMRQGYTPENACKEAVLRIIRKKPEAAKNLQVGFLALSKNGEYGAYAIQPGFTFAVCNDTDQKRIIQCKSFY